ncbi:MAG: ABC transporter ATP-binding protein [Alphaproteobacteria bacterium]|nr:ABC transporter ATP-binding protein [Alphaproteobacteria bacterium]
MTLAFEGIEKVYPNGFHAVKRLDLQIQTGEFFTLLGPSGCGKTTTLRMIAGLEMPTAGRLLIDGRDFTRIHPRDRDVAMVFQSYALYPHMSVRENLVLNLKVRRVPAAEIAPRLAEISRILGIDQLLDSKPARLSGGQRQRVALGRALIRRPNVFLMDEPLSNLDLKLRERTRTELKKLHERMPVTTVYVTHDQAEALVLSDRICIMNGGELQQVGTPQDVYDRPANMFVAKFVGTPSINLLPVAVGAGEGGLQLRLAKGGHPLDGAVMPATGEVLRRLDQTRGRAVLGIRPEAVALDDEPGAGSLPGSVGLVEPMGSVNHIVLGIDGSEEVTVDGEPFIAVVRSNERYAHGQPIHVSLRPDRLLLFDEQSGRSLAALSPVGSWELA